MQGFGIQQFIGRIKSSKQINNRVFWFEVYLLIIIILTSFIIYLHAFFPKSNTIHFFGWELKLNHMSNYVVFMHYSLNKFAYALFFLIWYLTARSWWKIGVLYISCVSIVQLIYTSILEFGNTELYEIYVSYNFYLAIVIPSVGATFFIYFLFKLFNVRFKSLNELQNIKGDELLNNKTINKREFMGLKVESSNLKKKKTINNLNEYLNGVVVLSSKIQFLKRRVI